MKTPKVKKVLSKRKRSFNKILVNVVHGVIGQPGIDPNLLFADPERNVNQINLERASAKTDLKKDWGLNSIGCAMVIAKLEEKTGTRFQFGNCPPPSLTLGCLYNHFVRAIV